MLVAVSLAISASAEDEFTEVEWAVVLGVLVAGLWGLGTAAVLAVDARRLRSSPRTA